MKRNNTILLVEDDEVDQEAIKKIFSQLDIPEDLDIVSDGEQALEYLKKTRPVLILLDLNMPRMGGLEFLQEKKNQNINIPTIVLTTSQENSDITSAYTSSILGYFKKPEQHSELLNVIRIIYNYWEQCESPA